MLSGKNRETCVYSILSLLGVLLFKVDSRRTPSVYFRFKQISKYTSDYESQVSLSWRRSDKYGKEEVSSE